MKRRSLLASLVVATSGVLSSCSSPAAPAPITTEATSRVTQQMRAKSAIPVTKGATLSSTASTVRTPDGSWQFAFSKPAKNLSWGGTTYDAAPGQQALVVSWLFVPAPPTSGTTSSAPNTPMTTLSTSGISLTSHATVSGSSVVSIPDKDAANPSATVAFDHANQTVNSLGVLGDQSQSDAAGFYDGLSTTGNGDCPAVSSPFSGTGGRYEGTCGLAGIARSPWLVGHGWAGSGKVWVQVIGIVNPGSMTWVDSVNGKNVTTNYTSTGSLTGASLAGIQATNVTMQGTSSYVMTFAVPAYTASMALKMTEILTGKATGSIKPPLTAPSTQRVSVDVTSPITFQKGN